MKTIDTLSMLTTIRCNRPVDLEKDWVSPGEYEMIMDGSSVRFDFDTILVDVDNIDPTILYIESASVDFNEFSEAKDITYKMLRNISAIEEFFFYTDELDGTNLEMVSVEKISFLSDDMESEIVVAPDVVKAYNEKLRAGG